MTMETDDKYQHKLRVLLGALDYLEYVFTLNRALVIRQNYIETLNNYNQTVVSLEHIAGIAKETAESAKQSKESASTLEYLSQNLNQAVEKFRLAE